VINAFALICQNIGWKIDYVTTKPIVRKIGYGSSLMNFIEYEAYRQNIPYLFLISNFELQPFYLKLHYDPVKYYE